MPNLSLHLRFLSSERPGPAVSWIELMDHAISMDGFHKLTQSCAGISQLEVEIDRLHRELEAIRKSARGKFTAHNTKFRFQNRDDI